MIIHNNIKMIRGILPFVYFFFVPEENQEVVVHDMEKIDA